MKWFLGLCLGSLLTFFMLDLARPGLPMTHDSNPHISRMIAYDTALEDGQFPPMWARDMLGGIGSPVMMLNYQLPYMLSEIWHKAGLSFFDSYKFTLGMSFVVSGILMYIALGTKLHPLSAIIGALIYTLAPYRFLDIYVRGALGESLTFIFPPLLILGFSTSSLAILILGWCGLFLTHPTASAAFSAFFLGYTILVGEKKELGKRLKLFGSAYVIALLISAFNLLPTLALTKYTYYSPELSDTLLMFPTLTQLFHSPWGYGVSLPGVLDGMSFELGLVQWVVLLLGLWVAIKTKNMLLKYLLGASAFCLFFILPISIPVYQSLHLTQIIDFPWRLMFCLVFASAWVGGELLGHLHITPLKYLITGTITVILVILSLPIAHTDKYWDKPIDWFARETGDSYGEYVPKTRVTRDSAPFGERGEFVEGHGSIELISDRSNYKLFRIVSEGEGVVRINTAYFPGWQIPDNCFVTKRTLPHIDDSGLIGCRVPPGETRLEIKFSAPPVQRAGNLLTLGGIGVYLWILYRSFCPRLTKRMR